VWTIEELLARVHAALSAQYPGAPNGRVRDLPDRRAVRWYATTGLVDRPAAMRGRTALYGRRHLLQLVAIKRRQADGRTLAQIQGELAGATDATLADVARVPTHLLADDAAPAPADAARTRFWADSRPAASTTPATAPPASTPPPASNGEVTLTGVPLGDGVVLLVPGRPAAGDHADIAATARPLLDLLAARGLTVTSAAVHQVLPTDRSPS
jgi:DNA-binding transcriptional MerR regulator